MNIRNVALWTSLGGLFLLAWVAPGQQPRRIDDAALRNAGKTGEEWLSYGLTPGETRYSPLKQIDATNAGRLGLSWLYEIGPGGGNQEGTLLMSNGALYGITNWSIVYAVDARTGKEKWRWDPEVNRTTVQPKICCGVVNRGIAVYEGNIIAPVIDGRLIALNMETGKPVWETRVAYSQDSYTLTMAPRIAKGKVIIGVAGAEYPVRGFFEAHDAKTGAFAWRDYTVPGDPSKPPENEDMRRAAATWSTEGMKMGGGGTVWDGMAYDPEADLFYVGTGNAGPWTQDARQQGKDKENLYAASILAVKPDTGKLAWYFQMVPGDEWDFDSVQQLLLADVVIKGQPRKVIMQANKNGFYYVIDRVTGKFISGQPFAQVTWARGLNEETGKPIINNESYYHTQSIPIAPGPGGAHNWSPMSFNPATGLVYLPASPSGSFNYSSDPNFKYREGGQNMGITFGGFGRGGAAAAGDAANAAGAAPAAPPKPLPAPPAIGPEPPEGGGRGGVLLAWDVVAQKERWRAQGGGGIGGGTVSTAGNLVFQVIPDGRLVAYTADKGDKVVDIQTGLRGGMGPPITYMLDGKQYVALAGGSGALPTFGPPPGAAAPPAAGGRGPAAPGGTPTPPPPPAPAAAGGAGFPPPTTQVTPKVLVFVLDGKAELPLELQQLRRGKVPPIRGNVVPHVLLRYIVKLVGLQNQSFTWETSKYFLVPMWRSYRLMNSIQDPVVAPAGIGFRAGSTQRLLSDVASPGIEHSEDRPDRSNSKGISRKGNLKMKTVITLAGTALLSFMATGCVATHKYVAKTISPVESRVSATEAKNTDQDKQLADHTKDLDSLSTDLSRTKERVTDADAKAVAAGQSAQRAGERADNAQRSADGAQRSAEGAQTTADRGLQRSDVIEKNMVAMNKFDMAKSVTVLFPVNQSKLNDDAKAELDDIAKMAEGKERFVIEVQGFTDKTGSPLTNEQLSQARAATVARYLANEHKIPVRSITTLGSGYALPVADDKTREGRKQNRRVEVRLFVPEAGTSSNTIASAQ